MVMAFSLDIWSGLQDRFASERLTNTQVTIFSLPTTFIRNEEATQLLYRPPVLEAAGV